MAGKMSEGKEWQGALCRLQNCLWLLKDQNLRRLVGFKVFRQANSRQGCSQYLMIVHVKADHVFSKYFKRASQADLALFRGMFMTLDVRGDFDTPAKKPVLTNCEVHQAFLPKFENESQDAEIASAILAQSGHRYMLVTVKHSGSLATLSHDLMGAKNSQNNIYTAVAVLLLKAHYQRIAASCGKDAATVMNDLLSAMKKQRLSVSFEVVARCLSHHGQIPQGEYMVVTSVTRLAVDGSVEVLPLLEHLAFCTAHHLPVNDAWLFSSPSAAAAVDNALDSIANAALPTASALTILDAVTAQHSSDAIRIHGTYPHSAWQGSRVEGFVIAQGAPVDTATDKQLKDLAVALRTATLPLPDVRGAAADGQATGTVGTRGDAHFAERTLWEAGVPRGADRGGGGSEDHMTRVNQALAEAAPELKPLMGSWEKVSNTETDHLLRLVGNHRVPIGEDLCMRLPGTGDLLPSRDAVAAASKDALRSLAGTNADALQHLGVAPPDGTNLPNGKFKGFNINAAMQALTGPLLRSRGLRYKKKMWSFRTAADALPPALAPLAAGPVSAPVATGGGSAAAHVSYCMMTFIIRNGIKSLKQGPMQYEGYVDALVRRWGLPEEQRRRVQEFGQCWSDYVLRRGDGSELNEALYLDTAEQFVELFLAERGATAAAATAAHGGTARVASPPAGQLQPSDLRHTGSSSSSSVRGSRRDLGDSLGRTVGSGASGSLVLLVGFTDDEMKDVAGQVGATGCGHIPRDGPDMQQGWVARLGQVPRPEEKQFWEKAVPLLKIVVRSPEATLPDALPTHGSGTSTTSKQADQEAQSEIWKMLDSMSCNIPSSLIESHLREGVAKHGREWLQARWLYIKTEGKLSTTGSAPVSSDGSLLSGSGSFSGEAGKRKPNKAGKQRNAKRASRMDATDNSVNTGVAESNRGQEAAAAALSRSEQEKKAAMAQVVAWLGDGFPAAAAGTASPAVHSGPETMPCAAPGARNDPALVVVFISTPGLGKTAICEALMRSLDPHKYHVVHHHSDAQAAKQRKTFWPTVNSLALTRRGDSRTTIVLADKNLIDNPAGNWDRTGATISVPVLAVLLTDEATAASLRPDPDGVAAPSSSVSSSTRASAAAAAGAAAEAIGRGSAEAGSIVEAGGNPTQGGAVAAAPAAPPPSMPVPFSMEQLALAMLRVYQRSDHVGGLDSRLDDVLQIMCGFAGAFRRLSPTAAMSHLKSSFHNVHVLPVCTTQSSAPAPSPEDRRDLMQLVCDGFRKGKFAGKGRGSGVPATWETRLRGLLGRDDIAAFLSGYARPLDTIVGDLTAAVERTAAAEAALKAPTTAATPCAVQGRASAPRPAADARAATPSHAAQATLRRCAYVGVGGFSRSAVAGAFAEAQRGAAGSGAAMHEAKDELHVTLWHRAQGTQERGLTCVDAEGAAVEFLVTGFDVSPTLSAARVEFPEHGTNGSLGRAVLDVQLPHITMHVGRGEKAVNARWLKRRQEAGEAGVRWLPLAEPLQLTGKVQLVER